jgi:hypothetical protein
MAPAVAVDPEAPFDDSNARLADWFLSPAVCYHTYAALEGECVGEGRIFTARGCCFRNEEPAEVAPGRRQVEFEMRELILVGEPGWIEARLATVQAEVDMLATECGLADLTWQPASDPFFLPRARGKAHVQRLRGTKLELCLPDGLAIASINRHGAFFGERFSIRTSDGAAAHSACVAFGLDRWVAAAAAPEFFKSASPSSSSSSSTDADGRLRGCAALLEEDEQGDEEEEQRALRR